MRARDDAEEAFRMATETTPHPPVESIDYHQAEGLDTLPTPRPATATECGASG
jgi:hypothetical protein